MKGPVKFEGCDAKAIGRRLRSARRSYGWSVEDLARAAGLSAYTVQSFETGWRVPSRDSAIRLALASRRKLDWLLLGQWDVRKQGTRKFI